MFTFLTRAFSQSKPRSISCTRLSHLFAGHGQRCYVAPAYTLSPDVAYIRQLDGQNKVQIQLNYIEPEFRVKRVFIFERPMDESIEQSVDRMQAKMQGLLVKKRTGKKAPYNTPVLDDFDLALENCHKQPVANTTWTDFLAQPVEALGEYALRVYNTRYSLMVNYPFVVSVVLPSSIIVGYDCYPSMVDLGNTSCNECLYRWYKGLPQAQSPNNLKYLHWIECGEGFSYRVQPDDIGHKLKLEITPRRGGLHGPVLEVYTQDTVMDDITNGFDAFEQRHSLTHRLPAAQKQFRVVSYNLLADFYADSNYSRTELFPYCPPHALAIDYRRRLILRELRGYNGDVVCLQEIDKSTFEGDLKTLLAIDGYDGTFSRKGLLPEGLATFYSTEKFRLIRSCDFDLGQGIQLEPAVASLYEQIKDNAKLYQRMVALPSSLQVTLLQSRHHDEYLLVANTHLYSQMDAAHIRLLQIGCSMLFIEDVLRNVAEELNITAHRIPLIFCGDMNSQPGQGVPEFMLEKRIGSDHEDFSSNEEQAVTNVALQHAFSMQSAYDSNVHTNYTQNFRGCLDYIFFNEDKLNLVQAVPMPDDDLLSANIAIPSIHFPSDHLALIADFEWPARK